ncbi:MAG: sugar phosphate isomerase/epimerase [Clostridiales bacterium]|jgi:sugar phosphate isomerase/epimerase|nr:sugar phosphate isomerase/epimerase [Clostridiales bacterium]
MNELKVGLQLYSIRDDMQNDVDATLKQVKDMGYDYVEFAGYFGKTAEEVLALLKKNGLECVSVHQTHDVFINNEKESIDFIKTIGAKYCAVPWMGLEHHAGTNLFEQTKKEFIQVGQALKYADIQLLYHNHDFEFQTFEDKFLLDWLYESIPSEILQTEIDTCWVKYAGQEPTEYIRKYAGRSPVVHLKDFVCKNLGGKAVYALIDESGQETKPVTQEDNGFEFRPLGQGMQDFPAIIEAVKEAGAKYIIVEQDQSPTCSPLQAAKEGREYLKSLGI